MSRIDQFESVFRAAGRTVYRYDPMVLERVLVVTDLDAAGAAGVGGQARQFLDQHGLVDEPHWRNVAGVEFSTVKDLLDLVAAETPDLICTYRHLHSQAWHWPYSLGEHLDVLAQATPIPVLVLPHPKAGRIAEHAMQDTGVVMAMTDHLTGDHRLVSYAADMVDRGRRLLITHVEDGQTFDRYMDIIAKLPRINTDEAREDIQRQLLEEPRDYIESCRQGLAEHRPDLTVEAIVEVGHNLAEYSRLVEHHEVDLLVLNTKDADQLAMHGLAYPVVMELRQIPLLLL
jgi:nucleotide-binding universal stress UspA family protein